jgi:hypothetical protein
VRKLIEILELTNLFIGFNKGVLAYVKGIFSVSGKPQTVAEKLLLPPPYEEIECFSVTAHHPLREIFVGQPDKRQWVSSLDKDVKER